MSTLTKLLPANAAPAQTLLDKAHALPLTSAQRAELPQVIHTPEGEVELGVPADQLRPVEVNDVFVDEKGGFWAVRPAVEKVLNVTGDVNVLREAAGALVNRGVRIAQIEEGFAVLPLPNLAYSCSFSISIILLNNPTPLDCTIITGTCKAFCNSSTVISSRKIGSSAFTIWLGRNNASPRSLPCNCFTISCPVRSPVTVIFSPKKSFRIGKTCRSSPGAACLYISAT